MFLPEVHDGMPVCGRSEDEATGDCLSVSMRLVIAVVDEVKRDDWRWFARWVWTGTSVGRVSR